jgi:hypothetical protein
MLGNHKISEKTCAGWLEQHVLFKPIAGISPVLSGESSDRDSGQACLTGAQEKQLFLPPFSPPHE